MSGAALPPPGVYDIPAGVPFLDVLVERLLRLEPGELASVHLLLPSRRTCELARRRFLDLAGGRPLLLPRIEPVGEVDALDELTADPAFAFDVPPAILPLHRTLLLARLVATAQGLPVEQAVRLASELGSLLDELATEEVDLDALAGLVPEAYAGHWQLTLRFLAVLRERWPEILAERGRVDPPVRRRLLLDARAERWRRDPPDHPVIAAGITGTVPAVARLLAVIARLPKGYVILPGLDRWLDDRAWEAVRATPTHPQWALARLLHEHLGVDRAAVRPFAPEREDARIRARGRLWSEVMRPAARAEDWRHVTPPSDDALSGLTVSVAADRAEEALEIALRMREALEEPGRTAILVTPDRNLARRVSAELQRWHLQVDDTGGLPLDQTPPGRFLLHLAHACLEDPAPAALLALLQHPFARGGRDPAVFRRFSRLLEREVLRGPRPAGGMEGLRVLLRQRAAEAQANGDGGRAGELQALLEWYDGLLEILQPLLAFTGRRGVDPHALLDAHLRTAEALARGPEEGDEGRPPPKLPGLWSEWSGRALRRFVEELRPALADLGPVDPAAWPAILAHLMALQTVRPPFGGHPRLAIVGQMESRLVTADLVILGGLDEGTWPRPAQGGPWLSRGMRADAGLPPAEQRIGFSAHDFVQAACAREVVITRSRRDEAGNPTVPSRWLQRLEAVLHAAGRKIGDLADPKRRAWAQALDRPDGYRPCARPQPSPPRHLRPRVFHATEIEHLLNDPFRVYARRILGLEPLDPLDADPTATERGRIVHAILCAFCRAHPAGLPVRDAEELAALLGHFAARHFDALAAHPHVRLVWEERFRHIARDVARAELERRRDGRSVHAEVRGSRQVDLADGEDADPIALELRARADRIERTATGLRIIDYKTGAVPGRKDIARGLAPQLLVEALIAAGGGFEGVPAADVEAIEYWRLSGTARGVEMKTYGEPELGEWLRRAEEGLRRLLRHFLLEEAPFAAVPRPEAAERFNPYYHLARVQEWWGTSP